jgi:hypothetical protein
VADDGGVVARGPGKGATVSRLLLDVADDGTLGEGGDGENVADVEACLLADVDKLARVHALGGDKGLGAELVAVRVTEDYTGEGSTTGFESMLAQTLCSWVGSRGSASPSRVVNNFLYQASQVAIALGVVEGPEAGRGDTVVRVRLEDATALTLVADDATHCAAGNEERRDRL